MDRPLVLVVACLLVLAGCGSDGSGPSSGPAAPETVTPAPIPEEPATPQPTPGRPLAPGLSTTGVDAPDRLVAAHVAALRDRSFRTFRREVTYATNGSLRSDVLADGRISADRRRVWVVQYVSGPAAQARGEAGRVEQYASGSTVVSRERRGRTVSYDQRDRERVGTDALLPPEPSTASTLSSAFEGLRFDVYTYPDRWFAAQYRLVSSGVTDERLVAALADDRARDVSFEATVTAEGLVQWYRLSYTTTREGVPVRVTRTVSFEAIGTTTIGSPSWYERAVGDATPNGTNGDASRVSRPRTPSVQSYASGVRSTTVPS